MISLTSVLDVSHLGKTQKQRKVSPKIGLYGFFATEPCHDNSFKITNKSTRNTVLTRDNTKQYKPSTKSETCFKRNLVSEI